MRQSLLIVSNATLMWVTRVLQIIPQLILVPFVIRTLGDDGYGIYTLVWSLLVSIDQLESSLQQGVVKHSAAFLAQKKLKEVNKLISTSFIYSALIACITSAGILIFAISPYASSLPTMRSLVIIGITVLLMIPLTPYIAIIQSRQLYYVGAIAETAAKYVCLFLIIAWFLLAKPSIEALIIFTAGTTFVSRLSQVPFAYKIVPGLQNSLFAFCWHTFRLIVSFGGAIVLISLCIMLNSTGVRWIMGTLVSPGFVGHLAIILMPSILLSQIILPVTITTMPASSAYAATGNRILLNDLLMKGMRYSTILVLSCLLFSSFLFRDAIILWVGHKYAFLAPYAFVLFLSTSFMLSASVSHHMLKGIGHLKHIVLISIAGLVAIPIPLLFVIYWTSNNPYIAVTYSLSIGNILYGIMLIFAGFGAIKIQCRRHLMYTHGNSLLLAAAVYCIEVALFAYFPNSSIFSKAFLSAFAVLLFYLSLFLFCASSEERLQFLEFTKIARNHVQQAIIHFRSRCWHSKKERKRC